VNAAEAGGTVTVTGTVGGDASPGDTVSLDVNGNTYSGTVGAGNTFSISVPGSDLAADTTLDATVVGNDVAGNPFSATTTSTHTVDTAANATISVDPITADDVVNAAEAGSSITVTGTVTGDATVGDTVSLDVNGNTYSGTVGAGNTFSISVPGSDLAADTTLDATVVGNDVAGNPFSAITTSTHSVDLLATATVSVDPVTADDIVNAAESGTLIDVTGTVGGDASPGDSVSFTINGTTYSGLVDIGNDFSIAVSGADLVADTSFDVTVTGTDNAGNPFSATATSNHGVDLSVTAPTVTITEDTNNNGRIGTDELVGNIDVNIGLPADAMAGDIVSLTDGSTSLEIILSAIDIGNAFVSASFPSPGEGNTITVGATLTDSAGNTSAVAQDTATINRGPLAGADAAALDEDGILAISSVNGVLANDSDPDNDSLNVSSIRTGTESGLGIIGTVGQALAGSYGTLTLNADGSYTYLADQSTADALAEGEIATDTFTYTIDDGHGGTDSAELVMTITGRNDAPVLIDDYYVVADNTTLSVNSTSGLLINDTDPDGDNISVTSISFDGNSYAIPQGGATTITTTNGELSVNSDGSFVYTPASADIIGVEEFSYTVTDSQGETSSAMFSVEVDADAENPVQVTTSLANGGYAYSVAEDKATGDAYLWRLDMLTGEITKIGLAQSIELGATIGLPITAAAGDTLTITGGNEVIDIELTAADITSGSVNATFYLAGASSDFTITASITDSSGNSSPNAIASALIDDAPGNAPGVTILDDSNNDNVISASELSGAINVAVGIPGSAVAGDTVSVTDGTTTTSLLLTSGDIASGTVTTTLPVPGEGNTLLVSATHIDGDGIESATGVDSALINSLGAEVPTVTFDKDIDGDGFIDIGDLKVQELDIEGLTYDPETGYLFGMGTGQHPGLFVFTTDEAYIAQNGGSAVVREYLELSGQNNDVVDINSGTMSGTIGPGDTLYYTSVQGNSSILYSIDKSNGEIFEIGDLGVKTIAFDYYAPTDQFLGMVNDTNKTYLHAFDLSDPANITSTQLFDIGSNLDIQGMSPGPNGNLWALDRATGEIFEVDVTTGTVSLLVSTSVNELQGDGFESLAVGPRPNYLEAGKTFTYQLSANFGSDNLVEEIHYFLVHLPDAALADGLEVPGGQLNASMVTLGAVNNYGLPAGEYVRIDADTLMDVSGTAEASLSLQAPLTPDSFTLAVYAVEEDTRTDLDALTNFAVTPASTDQTFLPTFEVEVSGTHVDGLEDAIISGSDTADNISGNGGDDVIFAGAGDDILSGGNGADKLHGGDGADTLHGGSENDALIGGAGDDLLIGGSGDDNLLGGAGIDIFALESGDEGSVGIPSVDTIDDFTVGIGGDVLDLSDMLQGEDLASLDSYMNFSYDGASGDTTISVDVDGSSGSFETAQQIVLTGVDLTANGTLQRQPDRRSVSPATRGGHGRLPGVLFSQPLQCLT
jgi:VCBS repeat-containing protein